MKPLYFLNRKDGKLTEEKIYGAEFLKFLYGNSFFGNIIKKIVAGVPFFSYLYGQIQKLPISKRKITPFIEKYDIDTSEFLEPVSAFSCFNDFFIRKLKPEKRRIAPSPLSLSAPADARYLAFNDISKCDGFFVKGKKFSLEQLLQSESLAKNYQEGAMLMGRLCPVDYHRFHFPCDGKAGVTRPINGWLYSVNPLAICQNIDIFTENKRVITEIDSLYFGLIQYIEVGATFVGTIVETYKPGSVLKGAEKGYFSFGGSSLILLFEPGKVIFDNDLIENSKLGLETLCQVGEKIGSRV